MELARELINIGRIRISDLTSFFLRITENFELLNLELVSLDCILILPRFGLESKKVDP